MGLQHKLAKMTAGTPRLEPGTGGEPELTGQDVAAAMGFVYGRVPDDCIGIHLVMAKYSDDTISITRLEKSVSRMAWLLWFDLNLPGEVKRSTINLLAKLALADYCETGKFSKADSERMAKAIEVDHYTWRNRYAKIYHEIQRRFSEMENPVMRILYRTLSNENSQLL